MKPLVHPAAAAGATALAISVLIGACELDVASPPPFRYIDVGIEVMGDSAASEAEAAPCDASVFVWAEIENTSRSAIEEFEALFHLYDEAGNQSPAFGRGAFSWENTEPIPSGARRLLCADLTEPFYYLPDTPPVVERFHIHTARLDDGTDWSDPFAAYVWSPANDGGNANDE